jgi:hypothetical protein
MTNCIDNHMLQVTTDGIMFKLDHYIIYLHRHVWTGQEKVEIVV